ncbi:MAG: CotH kinase family protein [Clostridia bacterium]|nr:CotH kinase family protein [Clostridia bacterium]
MKNAVKLLCLAFICLLFGVGSYAASYTDALEVAYDPPLVAVLPDGRELTPIDYRGDYFCFPGNVDLSDVSFIYTGEERLYLPDSDTFVEQGDTFETEIKVGEQFFYEYRTDLDLYYKYRCELMQGSDVSAMYIEFDDSYSFDVLNYLGESKEHSATGTLYMTDADGAVVYDGALENIRCRGNSSFGSPGLQGDKRSLNIKLAEKAELIAGAGEMRKWSLLHMRIDVTYDYDVTGLTTLLGFGAYESLCDEGYHTNSIQCVDVYIEGEYRGAYLLVERLDVNAAVDITDSDKYVEGEDRGYEFVTDSSDPAIAAGVQWYRYSSGITAMDGLDVTGGYILEVTGAPDRCGFSTSRGITFDLKAPEKCTAEQMQYISTYIQGFEDALYSPTGYNDEGKHYSDYADLKSLADSFLTYAFFQNWELMRTSTYLYKDVDGSDREKLTFGPVWDFETGAQTLSGDGTLFGTHHFYDERRQYAWLEQLWKRADFMAVAYESATALSDYMHGMVDGEDAGVYTLLAGQTDSMSMNWRRWALDKLNRIVNKFTGVEANYPAYAEHHIDAVRTRLNTWDEYWSEEYLLGARLENKYDAGSGEYTLTLIPIGNAGSCRWYRVTEDGQTEPIDGADSFTFVTTEEGRYYCTVEGENNAFYKRASGRVFSERLITMSLACDTAGADKADSGEDHFLVILLAGIALVLVGGIAAFTVVNKRKK